MGIVAIIVLAFAIAVALNHQPGDFI